MSNAVAEALAIFGTGIAAGTINTVVCSGTLITFPTLLAFGYAPVLANVSNNVGLVPGALSGVQGYRAELVGQRDRMLRLGTASLCGGLTGAILLLVLPAAAFKAIVPALVGIALVMVVVQPWLARRMAARQQARATPRTGADRGAAGTDAARADADGSGSDGSGSDGGGAPGPGVTAGAAPAQATATQAAPAEAGAAREAIAAAAGGPLVWLLVFCAGVYGGYFGAAQGVLLIGLLGIALDETLQRVNALKNVLAAVVNMTAAIVFIAVTHVEWVVAGLIAAGSIIGGQLGARLGRRLSPWVLRAVIVCVGIAALVKLLA